MKEENLLARKKTNKDSEGKFNRPVIDYFEERIAEIMF